MSIPMDLDTLIASAREQGASDVHIEPGLPVAFRVRGALRVGGEPVGAASAEAAAHQVVGEGEWEAFLRRGSHDGSCQLGGTRCRINVLRTARGVGLAIRLLAGFRTTLERLNLHPDLRGWVQRTHGLILICGPTGCGKSSTLAALIQEINATEARHIVTIESPIEYAFRPRRAFVRQREVGRDTPSFDQALVDALREDPDVLMVGEMRDPETMRLTLNAAETGHLVLSTVHSANCVEALQRIVAAFAPETQCAVAAQLADVLVAVMAQRLEYRPELHIRVPECEILIPTHPVKAHIRTREFFRIQSAMETGGDAGMWTWDRYRTWMHRRGQWFVPGVTVEPPDADEARAGGSDTGFAERAPSGAAPAGRREASAPATNAAPATGAGSSRSLIEIEPVEGGLEHLLRKLR